MKLNFFISACFPLLCVASPFVGPIFDKTKSVEVVEKDSGISSVDCIYVINLDNRTERWKRVRKLFEERGIRVNRFSAVNGHAMSSEELDQVTNHNPKGLKKGEIGVFLSHVSILQDAWEKGFETIWICEDDVRFVEDLTRLEKLICHLRVLDPNWDVLFTDAESRSSEGVIITHDVLDLRPEERHTFDFRQLKKKHLTPLLDKVGRRYGAYSYLVSRRGIEKYLQYYQNRFIYSQYDHDMHYISGLRQYAPRKDYVTAIFGKESDTQSL
ncbi:MAG: glycosyltransferase family 25 protein [Chlamydiia bacterium]